MPVTDTVWVVPAETNIQAILSQLITNAAVKVAGQDNSAGVLGYQVAIIREAIQIAGRVPLSQQAGSVPPGAEFQAYVLAANALTASTPNLGTVVVTLQGGVISPWNDLVKRANSYVDQLRKGMTIAMPSAPMVWGEGNSLVSSQALYNTSSQIAVSLQIGVQYYFTKGTNETNLVCGATTLTASGSFYASVATAIITGIGASLVFTGQLQKAALAANLARSGRVRGQYDLSTPGPFDCCDNNGQPWCN